MIVNNNLREPKLTNNAKLDKQDAKMREVCQEFESVFVSYLLQNMRKTVPNNNEEDGFSREVYTSMMDEEVAKAVSRGPGIGLAEVLYRQFTVKKS